MSTTISVILTTYNRPNALNKALESLYLQDEIPHEIIVADDGSSSETTNLINCWQPKMKCPLLHVWQEDQGFRAAGIRNLAVAASSGSYLIFLDGDCIVFPKFIRNHKLLAEEGHMVMGSRILCSPNLTKKIELGFVSPTSWRYFDWLKAKLTHNVNRIFPLLTLPDMAIRKVRWLRWQGIRTFNLGIWRKDFYEVNGFDESFQGWGHEDADLAVRLINIGVKRKDGQFSIPVLHLWHLDSNRENELDNMKRLQICINNRKIKSSIGIDKYIEKIL